MAHAIEGYRRTQIGQTIQKKSQVKNTSASKSQAVKKSSSNANAAVYTASRFEDVARNKSTYTAKATYTNPVLAKKQDTIARIAQSNKEAAKTTPNALSVAKNFFGGMVDAGVSTVVGLYNMGRHPVQTAKDIYNIAAHPSQTAEAIKGIAQELKAEFKEGNADVKSHMIGRAVGEIGLAIVGTKMVDKVAKGGKAVPAAKVTTEVTEATEEAAQVAKAVGTAVKANNYTKKYTPVEFKGTVKVDGEIRDVSRRVYQRNDIDCDYFDANTGLTNLERMKQGKPPIGSDGKPMQLHHLTQREKGAVAEIMEVTHQEYYSKLHGLVGDGESFRNNPILEKQYNNFRSKYWKWRAEQLSQ